MGNIQTLSRWRVVLFIAILLFLQILGTTSSGSDTNNDTSTCSGVDRGDTVGMADEESVLESLSHHRVNELFEQVFFAGGKVGPIWNQLNMTSLNMKRTSRLLYHAIHPIDLFVFFMIGFFANPIIRLIYNWSDMDGVIIFPYDESYLCHIAILISQAAKIAIILYVIDCCILIALGFGLHGYKLEKLSYTITKVIYIAWFAHRASVFKRYLLGQIFARKTNQLGRISIIDRLLDGMLFAVTATFILDVFDMEMGSGIKSMFAFGSASTLMIGLASRDLASMFVNGLALSTTNRMNEGDLIQFGNGVNGTIVKIGWTHTTIRNADNLLEVVPNSELGMQRVKNLSRVDMCRIQQNLRFSYHDIEKLPKVCADIIEEIKIDCSPKVIIDGTRPLRAVFVNYREDYLHVVVTAHFHNKPIGDAFFELQEKCLYAIHNAVKKNNVKFMTSFYPSKEPLN